MHLDWTIQAMPGVRDGIILGDPERTQDASGPDHPGRTSASPDRIFRGGELHARDWSISWKEGDAVTPRNGSSRDGGPKQEKEQHEDARLEHPGWRARRKGLEHPGARKRGEPKDNAPGLYHPREPRVYPTWGCIPVRWWELNLTMYWAPQPW